MRDFFSLVLSENILDSKCNLFQNFGACGSVKSRDKSLNKLKTNRQKPRNHKIKARLNGAAYLWISYTIHKLHCLTS